MASPETSSGFTLLELLVVIAIIGVLAAVVLASLGTSRNKGTDAGIVSNLHSIQVQAEFYYLKNSNTYGSTIDTSCNTNVFSDPVIGKAITNIQSINRGVSLVCNNTSAAYAVSSILINGSPTGQMYWCVDSASNAKYEALPLAANQTKCT